MTEHPAAADADVVIVGAGSGGYAAALRSAELGASVILIEDDLVGGTCLHRGCVPTKALLHVAEVAENVRGAGRVGVRATLDSIDHEAATEWRKRVIGGKHTGLVGLIAARGIQTVHGRGRLTADGAVAVGGQVYRGRDVILAPGAESVMLPNVHASDRVLTSTSALELGFIPDSVIVVGGGVIGSEYASAMRSLGADVTIVELGSRLVPGEDIALSSGLQRAYRKRGIAMKFEVSVDSITEDGDGVSVALNSGEQLRADVALVSVGRRPATDDLGLEDAQVRTEDGFIVVDDTLRTSAPQIWAIGDAVRGLQLAHRGFAHGIAVAERIAGHTVPPLVESTVPRVTYSHPELASVGVTQAAAIERLGEEQVETVEFPLAGNAKSSILGTSGMVKVVREKDGPVLGVHLIGDRVGELITEGQLAVAWEAHPDELATLIHPHPTQSEAVGEAFMALAGKPLHFIPA